MYPMAFSEIARAHTYTHRGMQEYTHAGKPTHIHTHVSERVAPVGKGTFRNVLPNLHCSKHYRSLRGAGGMKGEEMRRERRRELQGPSLEIVKVKHCILVRMGQLLAHEFKVMETVFPMI